MIVMRKVLQWGHYQLWTFEGEAQGSMVTENPVNDHQHDLLISDIRGSAPSPKRFRAVANWVISELALYAELAGLDGIRLEGRMKWARVLSGFELICDDGIAVLRKDL